MLIIHKDTAFGLDGAVLRDLMRDVLSKGKRFRFKAIGNSMTPFIKNGDVLTIAPPPKQYPAVGTVVAFTQPQSQKFLVHRLIAIQRSGRLLIKGDNAPTHDGCIPFNCVEGIVNRVERNGKQVNFGMGPERYIISLLNRLDLLAPCIRIIRRPHLPQAHPAK